MRMSWMSLAWSTQCPQGIILDTEKLKRMKNKYRKQTERDLLQNNAFLFSCFLGLCSAFTGSTVLLRLQWKRSRCHIRITIFWYFRGIKLNGFVLHTHEWFDALSDCFYFFQCQLFYLKYLFWKCDVNGDKL